MATVTPRALPEQGQIVIVRQRRYVVTDVLPSALPPPQPGSLAAPQHLVTLNAIEDEAVGEGERVIWEVKSGVRTVERIELRAVA